MIFKALKKNGILGMNRRIGEYILKYNPRKNYPYVDCKILTHQRAKVFGIPTPDLYFFVERYGDLEHLSDHMKDLDNFVVKPAHGSMGNGVLIVEAIQWAAEMNETQLITTRQQNMSFSDFKYYLSGILSGIYSLNGLPDQVIFQELLKIHPDFHSICYRGIPDIRVIVFCGCPVMAMIRLPTQSSGGRANLHQGAVGCGIDLRTGELRQAVYQNRIVNEHPDTHISFNSILIPHWNEALLLASRCYEMVNMGYIGIDIVIDPDKGPLLLEINARPGLSIQLANLSGLQPRLELLKNAPSNLTAQERIYFAQNLLEP